MLAPICDYPETTKKFLIEIWFHSDYGTCIFHPCVAILNPSNPFEIETPYIYNN